jgi:hypothetical protein
VARQLAEEEDGLGLLHRGQLQGGEVVLHDGGPCVAAHNNPAIYSSSGQR